MNLRRFMGMLVLAAGVLAGLGCKGQSAPKDELKAPPDTSGSHKMAVVSEAFLSPEFEEQRQGSHSPMVAFGEHGAGIAYIEPFEGKFRVVHNGRAGKAYVAIGELEISRDGKRVAYAAAIDQKTYRMVVDGREGLEFGTDSEHWFSPDGRHHVSLVMKDDARYLVVDNRVQDKYRILRSPRIRPDSGAMAFSVVSSDGSRKQFVIVDMELQDETAFDSCGEYILSNSDMTRLAVGCSDGGINTVKVIDFMDRHVISEIRITDTVTRMAFAPDNQTLVYTIVRPEWQRYIVWKDREEKTPEGEEFFSDPLVLTEPNGIGVIIGNVYRAWLYFAFQNEDMREQEYGYISGLVASPDGRHHAYVGTKVDEIRMQIVVNGHDGPKFDKIVSPFFSPDGRYLIYRAREAGRRFVVVSDMEGKTVREHPDYDMVFQPEFGDNGTTLAYGVLDGNELWWKVEKL